MTRRGKLLIGLASVSVLVTLLLLWFSDLPLGVPGEWVWSRITAGDDPTGYVQFEWLAGGVFAFVTGCCYLWIAARASQRIEHASRTGVAAWLTTITLAGFAFLWVLQDAPPERYRLSKSAFAMYYPSVSGYFHEAAWKIESTPKFLAGYEERIRTADQNERVLHVGTHPPGLFLLHRGLLNSIDLSPGLPDVLHATEPASVRAAFDVIAENARFGPHPLTARERAAAWLAILLTQLVAVAAVCPLYLLLRRCCDRATAVRLIAWWPLLPAVAVFLPKSDALYPFIGLLLLWLWMTAVDRNSRSRAFLAGVVCWAGMFLTLAFLPIAAVAAIATLLQMRWTHSRNADKPAVATQSISIGQLCLLIAIGFVGFAIPVVWLWQFYDLNLPAVWLQNYHNHAEFYAHFPRTWWRWLPVNLGEAFVAVGGPLAILTLCGTIRLTARRETSSENSAEELRSTRQSALGIACVFVWGLLWLSGKNQGEAARLWLIVFPWTIVLAAGPWRNEMPVSQRLSTRAWWLLSTLQLLACVSTVLRVSGFSLFGGDGS